MKGECDTFTSQGKPDPLALSCNFIKSQHHGETRLWNKFKLVLAFPTRISLLIFFSIPHLCFLDCLLCVVISAVMHWGNFLSYIHINIYTRQAPDCGAISIHMTTRVLMKKLRVLCVLICCDSECVTCSIRWNTGRTQSPAISNGICNMADFP